MLTPDDVIRRLDAAWRNNWKEWLDGGGAWPLEVPLGPPTERGAGKDWNAVRRWTASWENPSSGVVVPVTRLWRTLGTQSLPERVVFATAHEVAGALGRVHFLETADARYRACVAMWPASARAVRAHAETIALLSEEDFARLTAVVDWLLAHPSSGLFIRQLPVEGLDSKWVEQHTGLIGRLLADTWGTTGPLEVVAGLRKEPVRRRIRLLDPALRQWARGASDLEMPLEELQAIEIPARIVLVVENNVTALCCTDIPGAVLIMGGGAAVTGLGHVPWLSAIPLVYWGDIDTWGLSILAALRRYHPHTVSCLMDEETLTSHLHLRSHERRQTLSAGDGLTPAEQALFDRLLAGEHWGPGLRIEQERLEWTEAWQVVQAAASDAMARSGSVGFPP